MKKVLFMAALAAAALSSCSNEELVNVVDQTPIEDGAVMFSAYSARQTRAVAKTNPIVQVEGLANAGGFGVFGYEQGTKAYTTYSSNSSYPNFMYNQNVWAGEAANSTTAKIDWTDDNSATIYWLYSPVKYFSNNEGAKHSFFAYAPYADDVKSIFALGNAPAIRYTAGVDNYDLMWAAPYIDIPKVAVDQKLEFNFQHALSQVNIYVAPFVDKIHGAAHTAGNALDDNTKIKVRSVKFIGTVASQALLSLKDGSWRYEATEESAYEINDEITLDKNNNTSNTNPADASNFKYKPVTTNMMVIPTLAGQPINIQIVYDVITTDENNSVNSSTITNTIKSLETFNLVQGNAYNFFLDLGLTSVKFKAEAADWNYATNINVDLPNNNDFHLCSVVSLTAAPGALTANVEASPKPGTPNDGDYWYDAANNKMLKYQTSSSDWDGTISAGKYRSITAIYTVDGDGNVTKVEKTEYYSVTTGTPAATTYYLIAGTAISPTPIALGSLNVKSDGTIQKADGTWVAPTNDQYYTFDGKLYQWKSSAH